MTLFCHPTTARPLVLFATPAAPLVRTRGRLGTAPATATLVGALTWRGLRPTPPTMANPALGRATALRIALTASIRTGFARTFIES